MQIRHINFYFVKELYAGIHMDMEKGGVFYLKECRPEWARWAREGESAAGDSSRALITGTLFTLLLLLKELTYFGSLFMALSLVLENGCYKGGESKTVKWGKVISLAHQGKARIGPVAGCLPAHANRPGGFEFSSSWDGLMTKKWSLNTQKCCVTVLNKHC